MICFRFSIFGSLLFIFIFYFSLRKHFGSPKWFCLPCILFFLSDVYYFCQTNKNIAYTISLWISWLLHLYKCFFLSSRCRCVCIKKRGKKKWKENNRVKKQKENKPKRCQWAVGKLRWKMGVGAEVAVWQAVSGVGWGWVAEQLQLKRCDAAKTHGTVEQVR